MILVGCLGCTPNLPQEVIQESELPFSTALQITSDQLNAKTDDVIVYTATLHPKKVIPNLEITGNVNFYNEKNLLCADVAINPQTLSASCITQFAQEGMYIISAEYTGQPSYYKKSSTINFYQKVENGADRLRKTEVNLFSEQSLKTGSAFQLDINVSANENSDSENQSSVNEGFVSVYEKNQKTQAFELLESCKNLNIKNSSAICHVPTHPSESEIFGRIFYVQYLDTNAEPQYLNSASEEYYVSIDGPRSVYNIYIITNDGKMSYSSNNGKFWIYPNHQPLQKGIETLTSIFRASNGVLYVGSNKGNVFATNDLGNTWKKIANNLNNSIAIESIKLFGDDSIHVLFEDGKAASANQLAKENIEWEMPVWNYKTMLEGSAKFVDLGFFASGEDGVGEMTAYENGALKFAVRTAEHSYFTRHTLNSDIRALFLVDTLDNKAFYSINKAGHLFKNNFSFEEYKLNELSSLDLGEINNPTQAIKKFFFAGITYYVLKESGIEFTHLISDPSSWSEAKTPGLKPVLDMFVGY